METMLYSAVRTQYNNTISTIFNIFNEIISYLALLIYDLHLESVWVSRVVLLLDITHIVFPAAVSFLPMFRQELTYDPATGDRERGKRICNLIIRGSLFTFSYLYDLNSPLTFLFLLLLNFLCHN